MSSRSWRRTGWIGGTALVVGLMVVYYTRAEGKTPPVRYDTATVDRGPVVAKVTASGTLSALVTVQVGSQVSGRIQTLYADFNSHVKKGQLLAKIDPRLFDAAVEQAQANLLAAEGNLARATAQAADAVLKLQRSKDLFARHLVAQSDYDTARATADADRAAVQAASGSVEQARASLDQAKTNLGLTDIISPTDGIVISRNVDVGQTVAASFQAPVLFEVAQDLSKMQVDTSVAESDIGRLVKGMPATFTVDAYPGTPFTGTVREIRNAPQTVQNVVTYDAVIDVDNPALKLKPGMTANVTFVWANRRNVLRVGNAALRFRPDAALFAQMTGAKPGGRAHLRRVADTTPADDAPNRRTLWVLRGDHAEPVHVEIGVSDGTHTEITGGDLRAGDRVVIDAEAAGAGAGRGFRRGIF
jgi:HlyD family secretion protein